jgi:hypothetical protein
MNVGGIFALFGFNGDDKEDKKLKKELETFKETPHFKVRMFIKMISQGIGFKNQLLKFFSNMQPKIDTDDLGEAGDFMMYNRAWFWISECNLRKKDWKVALQDNASEDFIKYLEIVLRYFESLEEFEKCAFLKKIQDFVKKSLIEKGNVTP